MQEFICSYPIRETIWVLSEKPTTLLLPSEKNQCISWLKYKVHKYTDSLNGGSSSRKKDRYSTRASKISRRESFDTFYGALVVEISLKCNSGGVSWATRGINYHWRPIRLITKKNYDAIIFHGSLQMMLEFLNAPIIRLRGRVATKKTWSLGSRSSAYNFAKGVASASESAW